MHTWFHSCPLTAMISFLGCRTDADGKAAADGVKPSQRPDRSRHCGNWVRNTDGGSFSSPNYPQTYPPNKECLYVLEGNQNNAPVPHEITAHNLKSVAGMDIELGQFFFIKEIYHVRILEKQAALSALLPQ